MSVLRRGMEPSSYVVESQQRVVAVSPEMRREMAEMVSACSGMSGSGRKSRPSVCFHRVIRFSDGVLW